MQAPSDTLGACMCENFGPTLTAQGSSRAGAPLSSNATRRLQPRQASTAALPSCSTTEPSKRAPSAGPARGSGRGQNPGRADERRGARLARETQIAINGAITRRVVVAERALHEPQRQPPRRRVGVAEVRRQIGGRASRATRPTAAAARASPTRGRTSATPPTPQQPPERGAATDCKWTARTWTSRAVLAFIAAAEQLEVGAHLVR